MPQPLGNKTGLNSIDDLLEIRFRSPLALGLDTIAPVLQRDLAVHNMLTNDMVSIMSDITDDYRRVYGSSDVIEMIEADEFSRAHTQKGRTGSEVGFPMRGFQSAIGWDRAFFQRASVADMAQTQVSAQKGQVIRIRTEMQKALYLSANFAFIDYRDTKVSLPVKRFINADGLDIPDGPLGQTFNPATHTHYLATASATQANVNALIQTVLEHHINGQPVLIINQADETQMRAITGFQPYIDSRITLNANANQPTTRLNPFTTDNRPIGLFGSAEVWVKPWALPSYWFMTDMAASAARPLACRVRKGKSAISLDVMAELDFAPLYAKYMESEFGFGVWTRTNGAVLYTGGGAYVDPVL
jgi:hypothetical protein